MTHYVLTSGDKIPDQLLKGKKKLTPEWKQRLRAHRQHLQEIRPKKYYHRLKQEVGRCENCKHGRHDECLNSKDFACKCEPCPQRNTGFKVAPDDFTQVNK